MIYIAGKFTSQARLREMRSALQRLGFTVSSFWLDETATEFTSNPSDASHDKMVENATRDWDEAAHADIFILDTLDESNTGGREVELGIAFAMNNADIYRVGPVRNIFHRLIPNAFKTWDDLLDYLDAPHH